MERTNMTEDVICPECGKRLPEDEAKNSATSPVCWDCFGKLSDRSVCPSCESANIVKYVDEHLIDVGPPPDVVRVPVTFPAWKCQSCRFGWRDHEAEAIIEATIRAHPEASKLFGA